MSRVRRVIVLMCMMHGGRASQTQKTSTEDVLRRERERELVGGSI